jgi:hypothetical protein
MWEQGRHATAMSKDSKDAKANQPVPSPAAQTTTGRDGKRKKPEWADGLRQLYDSVLHEPLPDSFEDLLSKLDDEAI